MDTVFVRGLPHDTTDEQLLEKFTDVGPVKHAYCLRDKVTQRVNYGFVKFAITEDAQVASDTLSGALLNGKRMQVEIAIERGTGSNKAEIALKKSNRKKQESIEKQSNKERRLRTLVLWVPSREVPATTTTTTTSNNRKASISKKNAKSSKDQGSDDEDDDYSEESADEVSDDEDEDEDEDHKMNRTDSASSAVPNFNTQEQNVVAGDSGSDSEDEITDEDLLQAVLQKHSLTNAEVQSGQRRYGNRAFLVTFADANKARNAYRRLKKVATAFYPKREFNISLTTKAQSSSRLIVRNLAWKANEKDMMNVFELYGPVRSVHFPQQEEKSRGFCFVQYWTRDDALRAVKGGNAQSVHGREIAVDLVTGDQNSSSSAKNATKEDQDKDKNKNKNKQDDDSDDSSDSDGDSDGNSDGDSNDSDDDDKKEEHQRDGTDSLTLFVRNLPFGAEEDELYQAFRSIGPVHYAKIVRDKATNRSQGTAFIRFREQSSVATALDQNNPISIAGRELNVVRAVTKDQAKAIADASAEERTQKRKKEDRRHLYLAREGKLTADMEEGIPKADSIKRQNADREKQQKLTNPNFFVSPTRLSVRNIARRPVKIPDDIKVPGEGPKDLEEPRMIDNKLLKAICLGAAKKGLRDNVVREDEGDQALMPVTKSAWRHVKIVQSKIVADDTSLTTSTEELSSRGYGFVEFTEHAHALAALRMLNNNPNYFWCAPGPKAASTPNFRRNRLIVEFAVEDAKKLAKRGKKLIRNQQYSNAQRSTSSSTSSSSNSSSSSKTVTSKRKAEAKSKQTDSKRQKQSIDRESTSKKGGATTDGGEKLDRKEKREMQKKKKERKTVPKPAASKSTTTSLVSSMKANAKRWFE